MHPRSKYAIIQEIKDDSVMIHPENSAVLSSPGQHDGEILYKFHFRLVLMMDAFIQRHYNAGIGAQLVQLPGQRSDDIAKPSAFGKGFCFRADK